MHVLPVVPEAGADGAAGDGDLVGFVSRGLGGLLESGWGGSWRDEAQVKGGSGEMNRGGPGCAATAAVGDDSVGGRREGGVVAVICYVISWRAIEEGQGWRRKE